LRETALPSLRQVCAWLQALLDTKVAALAADASLAARAAQLQARLRSHAAESRDLLVTCAALHELRGRRAGDKAAEAEAARAPWAAEVLDFSVHVL
jgi:hypothetical protein